MKVVFVGSHLFEKTHHTLAALAQALSEKVDIEVFAKYPKAHEESGTRSPLPLAIEEAQEWAPNADVVHAVGGGETAIRVASVLRRTTPLVVSFVGGTDTSRQLSNPRLRNGYIQLFTRCDANTNLDEVAKERLVVAGAPLKKLFYIPPALPLEVYPLSTEQHTNVAVMAGRPIGRKGHLLAVRVGELSRSLQGLRIFGCSNLESDSDKISFDGLISHKSLIDQLVSTDILLQTGCADELSESGEMDVMPMLVLEALAMGLAVVSTPLPGVVGLAKRHEEAVFVGNSAKELASLMDTILNAAKPKSRVAVRDFVLERYQLKTVVKYLTEIYSSII